LVAIGGTDGQVENMGLDFVAFAGKHGVRGAKPRMDNADRAIPHCG
jgi:hypothetical protein